MEPGVARSTKTRNRNVRWGSISEILVKSTCFPLCPQQRTYGDHGGMSVWCCRLNRLTQHRH